MLLSKGLSKFGLLALALLLKSPSTNSKGFDYSLSSRNFYLKILSFVAEFELPVVKNRKGVLWIEFTNSDTILHSDISSSPIYFTISW